MLRLTLGLNCMLLAVACGGKHVGSAKIGDGVPNEPDATIPARMFDAGDAAAPSPPTSILRCGVGQCTRVVHYPAGSDPPACPPIAPIAEACNGLDDDCDGFVDEGLSYRVVGAPVPLRDGGQTGDCSTCNLAFSLALGFANGELIAAYRIGFDGSHPSPNFHLRRIDLRGIPIGGDTIPLSRPVLNAPEFFTAPDGNATLSLCLRVGADDVAAAINLNADNAVFGESLLFDSAVVGCTSSPALAWLPAGLLSVWISPVYAGAQNLSMPLFSDLVTGAGNQHAPSTLLPRSTHSVTPDLLARDGEFTLMNGAINNTVELRHVDGRGNVSKPFFSTYDLLTSYLALRSSPSGYMLIGEDSGLKATAVARDGTLLAGPSRVGPTERASFAMGEWQEGGFFEVRQEEESAGPIRLVQLSSRGDLSVETTELPPFATAGAFATAARDGRLYVLHTTYNGMPAPIGAQEEPNEVFLSTLTCAE